MPDRVRDALIADGKKSDRVMTRAELESFYDSEGYGPNPSLVDVLTDLGEWEMLDVEAPGPRRKVGPIQFNPRDACEGENERILQRASELGLRFWPVGEWSYVYIVLVDQQGRLYAEAPEYGLKLLGETFEQGLEQLVFGTAPLTHLQD